LQAGVLPWSRGAPATWYSLPKSQRFKHQYVQVSDRCVTERTGPAAFTDVAPDNAATKMGPAYLSNSNSPGNCGAMIVANADVEKNSVQPLSSDKNMLKRRIDKLAIGGGTAGHLGTAWAWYMLSPNWGYLWQAQSQPKPYGAEKVNKYAILMMDGEYNTMYCNGAQAKKTRTVLTSIATRPTDGRTRRREPCAQI
jgi:hypothetical protein